MRRRISPWKFWIGFILLFWVFALGYRSVQIKTEHNQANDSSEDLANCLKQKGVILYGVEDCEFCLKQKMLFGTAQVLLNDRDCQKEEQECRQIGVKGYPLWLINGRKYQGLRSLSELAIIANCPYKI